MKNLLKAKRRKFNSKKGITLVELIVAVMILLVVVSASVRGITISYRSASMGAVKNDAQSVAQRDCDFIMSAIVGTVENVKFSAVNPVDQETLGGRFIDNGSYCIIDDALFHDKVKVDTRMGFVAGGYDGTKFADLQAISGTESDVASQHATDYLVDHSKNYHYYTVKKDVKRMTASSEYYQVYKITTYVYYSENGFVTCEGEVCILPQTA